MEMNGGLCETLLWSKFHLEMQALVASTSVGDSKIICLAVDIQS
jgi:hypothetical protein